MTKIKLKNRILKLITRAVQVDGATMLITDIQEVLKKFNLSLKFMPIRKKSKSKR